MTRRNYEKRIYSILLVCLLIAALAGCGKKAEAVATETTVAQSQETTEESKAAEASTEAEAGAFTALKIQTDYLQPAIQEHERDEAVSFF